LPFDGLDTYGAAAAAVACRRMRKPARGLPEPPLRMA
jgi:hypothetical protein